MNHERYTDEEKERLKALVEKHPDEKVAGLLLRAAKALPDRSESGLKQQLFKLKKAESPARTGKRGPGRPPKSLAVAPKRRGRPRKAQKLKRARVSPEEVNVPKRGPGRPRKALPGTAGEVSTSNGHAKNGDLTLRLASGAVCTGSPAKIAELLRDLA